MIILLQYVEAHISIIETYEKFGVGYRMMLVLLLVMHLLVVDKINAIPFDTMILRIKRIDCKDFRINVRIS